jgi:D-alanyl-D-alanine carboxypeptidase/D-alanyl-D-alanine-endopeptidase (penicillin-binding protein 4)
MTEVLTSSRPRSSLYDCLFASQIVIVLLIATAAPAAGWAQQSAPAESKPQTRAELQSRIDYLLDQPQFASARWGLIIIAGQGDVVFERDPDKLFVPASNMKLYTTAAALNAFGPDFRFKTSVYASTPLSRGGLLRGDLIFVGRGDPNLSARFDQGVPDKIEEFTSAEKIGPIETLADQIKASGIRRVAGDLVGDDSYFATDWLGAGWEWDDAQFYYGAEVSALSVNDNAVTFIVTPGRVGAPPTIVIQPRTDYVTIRNHATTSAGGLTRITARRPLNGNTVEFIGSLPQTVKEHRINIAIHDPASFAATLLKEALARRGIHIMGRIRHLDAAARLARPLDDGNLTEVASVLSPPVSLMLKVINKASQNLHAEIMLRQLGVLRGGPPEPDDYGRPKSAETRGIEALKNFLLGAAVETQPLSLRDGSGLSRQDLVTPRATARLLEFMTTHPYFATFRDSLPIGAVDGTLSRRMSETPAANNVRAKTGSLSQANALSGYITTGGGQTLILSLMGNNYTGPARDVTRVFDQICVLLAGYEGEI